MFIRVGCLTVVALAASFSMQGKAFATGVINYNDPQCARFSADGVGTPNVTITCASTQSRNAQAATAPQMSCSAVPSVPVVAVGSSVKVTASCSPSSSATSYAWTTRTGSSASCPAAPPAGQVVTIAPPGSATNCSYLLNATDPTYGQSTAVVTVNWGS